MKIASALLVATALLAAQPGFAKPVGKRLANQEARIKQGEKSGELTKAESKDLQAEHKDIKQEVKADRAANGGKLTKGERRHVKKQLNKESKDIRQEKHDGQVRPGSPADAAPASK